MTRLILAALLLCVWAGDTEAQRLQTWDTYSGEARVEFAEASPPLFVSRSAISNSIDSDDSIIEGFLIGGVVGAAVGMGLNELFHSGSTGGKPGRRLLFLTMTGLGIMIGSAIDAMV